MKAVNDLVPTVNACLRDMWPDVDPITGRFLNDHLAALPRVNRAITLLAVRWLHRPLCH